MIDSWTEDTHLKDRPSGNTDTMLQSIDFREFNQILSVAPGENNTLLSIFQDKYSEFFLHSLPFIVDNQDQTMLQDLFLYIIAL